MGHVGFAKRRFSKPPNCVNRRFYAHFSFIYPFDWSWQCARIVPVEWLGQMKPYFITQSDQRTELIQTVSGLPFFVCPANIDHETAVIGQLLVHKLPELTKPVHIFRLALISIRFFSLECKRRACDNQIDTVIIQFIQKLKRITTDALPMRRRIFYISFKHCCSLLLTFHPESIPYTFVRQRMTAGDFLYMELLPA